MIESRQTILTFVIHIFLLRLSNIYYWMYWLFVINNGYYNYLYYYFLTCIVYYKMSLPNVFLTRKPELTESISLNTSVVIVHSVVPPGHPAQWVASQSSVAGPRPGTLWASGCQVGQLFAGIAAPASAQLSAWRAARTTASHPAQCARVHHRVRT